MSKPPYAIVVSHAFSRPMKRWAKFVYSAIFDVIAVLLAITVAGLASFPSNPPLAWNVDLYYFLPIALLTIVTLLFAGFYWVSARYIGFGDFIRLTVSCLIVSFGLIALSLIYGPLRGTSHLDFFLLFFFITLTIISAVRVFQRLSYWNKRVVSDSEDLAKPERTIIIGAGDAGEILVREVLRSRSNRYDIVGFLDDDVQKVGMRIHGIRVLGTIDELPKFAAALTIDEALIAIPTVEGTIIRKIFDLCRRSHVRVKTLPSLSALLQGPNAALTSQLRHVEIEDLLRRKTVKADINKIAGFLRDESVLITGAGGSIGGELARQISSLPPHQLTLLGRGENSIYEIEQELIGAHGYRPVAMICDVRSRDSLERVFNSVNPSVVFHAAAHKHVPLMETNPIEAIENNIKGTWNLIQASIQSRVSRFILVSTDKAVKPSSIMGASKRVCELMVQAYAQSSDMRFASVRFGNVLGSRGSIVPLLEGQIKRGGPVRITHEDMTRFFMTIPEAAQLIVQAGYMGSKGEIFILDMGAAVKIKDLAYDLISLHGLVPEKDIEVEVIGTRPGEKLNEELTYDSEQLLPTQNSKISIVPGESMTVHEIESKLEYLFRFCERGDERGARQALMEMVNPILVVRSIRA